MMLSDSKLIDGPVARHRFRTSEHRSAEPRQPEARRAQEEPQGVSRSWLAGEALSMLRHYLRSALRNRLRAMPAGPAQRDLGANDRFLVDREAPRCRFQVAKPRHAEGGSR